MNKTVSVSDEKISIIQSMLKRAEKKHDVIILYAVESGSRAWGFFSDKSDYDVRFIYKKNNLVNYISVLPTLETVSGFEDDGLYDYQGWDIVKAVKHLKESNPSILEWMYSPIIYYDNGLRNKFQATIEKMHTKISLMFHYYNMARRNWNDWISGNNEVITKKYLYVIRPVAMLQYLLDKSDDNKNILIIDFADLLDAIKLNITDELREEIWLIIKSRTSNNDTDTTGMTNGIINDWVLNQFKRFDDVVSKNNDGASDVNFTVQSVISIYKKLENETKKVITLTNKHGSTDRGNYLSAIGFGLQLVWLTENPDKDARSLPSKIHELLSVLKTVDSHIIDNIKIIVDNKCQEEKKKSNSLPKMEYIFETFIEPLIEFVLDFEKVEVQDDITSFSPELKMALKNFKYNGTTERADIVEFVLKNCFNTLWLLGNPNDGGRDIPHSIIHTDDKTHTFSKELLDYAKNIIEHLKPKYIVSVNATINEWLSLLVKKHSIMITETHAKLTKIREINVEARFKKSIAKLDENEFDKLITSFF